MIGMIDHVGIAVNSIDEGRRFYEALGLESFELAEAAKENRKRQCN